MNSALPHADLPSARRSRTALRMTAAASIGRFELQRCNRCGTVQYPPREACHRCLSLELVWTQQPGAGELIAATTLFHSQSAYFRRRLPWRIGLVRLDDGPTLIAHLHEKTPGPSARVRISARLDRAGQAVLFAAPVTTDVHGDRQLRDLTCDPCGRNVLLTRGESPTARALVRELLDAGAALIWVGSRQSAQAPPASAAATVVFVPLDPDDPQSLQRAAAQIGARVDILIHDGLAEEPAAIGKSGALARSAALAGVADAFAPALGARAIEADPGPVAWVNILSSRGLPDFPAPPGSPTDRSRLSADDVACYRISRQLRAIVQPAGIRVANVIAADGDTEANVVAQAVLDALEQGLEEKFPADTPQQWLTDWVDGDKMRELDESRCPARRPQAASQSPERWLSAQT